MSIMNSYWSKKLIFIFPILLIATSYTAEESKEIKQENDDYKKGMIILGDSTLCGSFEAFKTALDQFPKKFLNEELFTKQLFALTQESMQNLILPGIADEMKRFDDTYKDHLQDPQKKTLFYTSLYGLTLCANQDGPQKFSHLLTTFVYQPCEYKIGMIWNLQYPGVSWNLSALSIAALTHVCIKDIADYMKLLATNTRLRNKTPRINFEPGLTIQTSVENRIYISFFKSAFFKKQRSEMQQALIKNYIRIYASCGVTQETFDNSIGRYNMATKKHAHLTHDKKDSEKSSQENKPKEES